MSTKVVLYITENCLPCSCKGTVNVIICTIYGQTVPGQIQESSATSGCESGEWKYQISYDSNDLPEGVTALATTDITSVACEGCLVTWIREQDVHVVIESDHGSGGSLLNRADNEEIERLSITITNPSKHKIMKGVVHWNWVLEGSANGDTFTAAANSSLEIDGVDQGTTGSAQFTGPAESGFNFLRSLGAAGFQEVNLDPEETKTIDLVVIAPASSVSSNGTASVGNVNMIYQGANSAS